MGVACFTLLFVYLFLPETKDLSLEQLEEMLHDLYMEKKKGSKWSSLCYVLKKRDHASSAQDAENAQRIWLLLKNV